MTNAELIKALRHCGDSHSGCSTCSYRSKTEDCMGKLCFDAADALEVADIKIADYTAAIEALDDSNDAYIKENEQLKKLMHWMAATMRASKRRVTELESQIPKEGKWIEQDDGDSIFFKCSVCGKIQYNVLLEMMQGEYHYCPNCGAKMRGEHDGEQ